jgi:glycerol-3-phosphate cytidylyltransferase
MKIGITASAFDLLHVGHVEMLREAKEQCDYLIAALHVNPAVERQTKNKPIQSVVERYIQLAAVKFVDEVIPYETEEDLLDIIKLKSVNIRILGEEYKNTNFSGNDLDMEFYFNKRRHRFSSSELRKRLKEQ